jgi:hypothetical protein
MTSWNCCLCRKVALYRVGCNGYCKEHRSEAIKVKRMVIKRRDLRKTEREQAELEQFGNLSDWWKGRTIGGVKTK